MLNEKKIFDIVDYLENFSMSFGNHIGPNVHEAHSELNMNFLGLCKDVFQTLWFFLDVRGWRRDFLMSTFHAGIFSISTQKMTSSVTDLNSAYHSTLRCKLVMIGGNWLRCEMEGYYKIATTHMHDKVNIIDNIKTPTPFLPFLTLDS